MFWNLKWVFTDFFKIDSIKWENENIFAFDKGFSLLESIIPEEEYLLIKKKIKKNSSEIYGK